MENDAGNDSHPTLNFGPSQDTALSPDETLGLFSRLLDSKLDRKFEDFKRGLEQRYVATDARFKKLKVQAKASSNFQFKGNKVQFDSNSNLLDLVDAASAQLLEGNLEAVRQELDQARSSLQKRNKVLRFADKSPAGWSAVEEYESDDLADDSEDEKKAPSSREESPCEHAIAKAEQKPPFRSQSNSQQEIPRGHQSGPQSGPQSSPRPPFVQSTGPQFPPQSFRQNTFPRQTATEFRQVLRLRTVWTLDELSLLPELQTQQRTLHRHCRFPPTQVKSGKGSVQMSILLHICLLPSLRERVIRM